MSLPNTSGDGFYIHQGKDTSHQRLVSAIRQERCFMCAHVPTLMALLVHGTLAYWHIVTLSDNLMMFL